MSICVSACVLLMTVIVVSEGVVEPCGRHKRDIMMPIYNEPPSFYDSDRQARRHNTGHHSSHHVHNHNHPTHPRDFPWGRTDEEVDNSPLPIPTDLMSRLNEVETLEDFMKHVIKTPLIGNRFQGDDEDTSPNRNANLPTDLSNVPMAQPAKCRLEEVTVPLDIPHFDSNHIYFPTCTRVMRCGGCCTNTITSCQATRSENITMKVVVTEYQGDNHMMTFKRMEEVQVENHTNCRCSCKIKAKDCKPLQIYKSGECRCACINVDEMQKCEQENDTKVWDFNTCHCSCRDERLCSTGSVFNSNTCSCMRVPQRRRAAASALNDRHRREENKQPSFHPRPVIPHPFSNNQEEN